LPPLLERPTTSPRPFDSFQLRLLRAQLEGAVPSTRAIVRVARRSRLIAGVERRVRASPFVSRVLVRLRRAQHMLKRVSDKDHLVGRAAARAKALTRAAFTPNYATLDMQESTAYRLWRCLPSGCRTCLRPVAYRLQRWNPVRRLLGKG